MGALAAIPEYMLKFQFCRCALFLLLGMVRLEFNHDTIFFNFTFKIPTMKKNILFLFTCLAAMSSNAQSIENAMTSPKTNTNYDNDRVISTNIVPSHEHSSTARTTAGPGGSRWYNYAVYQSYLLGTGNFGTALPYQWFDLTATCFFTGGTYSQNNLVSSAMILDPLWSRWGNVTDFGGAGLIVVKPTDSYIVDSVNVVGKYGRGNGGTYTDSLIISVIYGNGSAASSIPGYSITTGTVPDVTAFPYTIYGVHSLTFLDLYHDSVRNHCTNIDVTGSTGTRPAPVVFRVPLPPGSENDTDANGLYNKSFAVPGPLTVPAGNYVAMSVTFKSMDPSYVAGDTVIRSSTTTAPGGMYKHGMFRPLTVYNNMGGAIQYPPYNPGDWNEGVFKIEPTSWKGQYLPMQVLNSGVTASTLQYPDYAFHIRCAACDTVGTISLNVNTTPSVNNVKAYPNPAGNELQISYALTATQAVTVSLTNVTGQLVAKKDMGNTAAGNAVFNTSALPAGVYIYTLEANGERTTGHVSIVH